MKTRILMIAMVLACMMSGTMKAQNYPTQSADVSPMLVGEQVNDAKLTAADGKATSLSALINNKKALVVFYRGAWCPNCIKNFQEEYKPHLDEIERQGYNLILIAPDVPAAMKQTAEKVGIDMKYFYGDPTNALAKQMGVVWQQDKSSERMVNWINGASESQNTEMLLPVPAVYIINPEMEILFADIRPNAIPSAKRIKWGLLGNVLPVYK